MSKIINELKKTIEVNRTEYYALWTLIVADILLAVVRSL